MNQHITRRHFIHTKLTAALAAAAFPSILPGSVLGKNGKVTPGNRVTLGCIGVGPQGRGDMGGFLGQADVQVVGVCDVAKTNLEAARAQVNQKYHDAGCAVFGDYRELLARKDIDAVLIATPDHWHVPTAVSAARAGKDIYLEKPMGLSIAEDQLLRKTVRKHERIFQFGTQQRSSREFRRACELVRSGRIGKLKQINVWCAASRPGGSTTPALVPDGLDYERWLGPARFTPYTVDKCFDVSVPGAWKTWWYNYDYALGFVAGWGVHPLDIAYWAHPAMMTGVLEVEGKAIIPTEGACNTAIAWDVNFSFADGVVLRYKGTPNGYDKISEMNDLRPWHSRYGAAPDHGTAFEGTDGWVMVHRGGLHTHPESLAEEKPAAGDVHLTESPHHARNFVDSIKRRTPAICPIEDAVQADILCHLSDIAMRLNRKLKWDAAREHFVKDAEANHKLAMRPVRRPYQWA